MRSDFPPYSECPILGKRSVHQRERFFSFNDCCLKHCSAIKKHCDNPAIPISREDRLDDVNDTFNRKAPVATIVAEYLHQQQTKESTWPNACPSTFMRMACCSVRTSLDRLWYDRGGRSLQVAPGDLKRKFGVAFAQRVKRTRKSNGSPFYYWFNAEVIPNMPVQDSRL